MTNTSAAEPDPAAPATGLSAGWRPHAPQSLRPGAPLSPAQRAAASSPPAPGEDLLSKETQRIPLPMLRRNNTPAAAPPPASPGVRWQAFRSAAVRLVASFCNLQEAEAKVASLCQEQGILPNYLPTREQLQALMDGLVKLAPSNVYGDVMRRELSKLL